jgi:hypothetical protein
MRGMAWIKDHKTGLRMTILVLLLVALLGPWWFDRIVVPVEYTCPSAVRLEGDYCGIPMAGAWILFWVFTMPISFVTGLIAGATTLADLRIESLRSLWVSLYLCAIVLPFFNTLFLILHGESRRQRVFTSIVWFLAVAGGLLFGFSSYPNLFWVLWGVWLYIGLALSALILELLVPA